MVISELHHRNTSILSEFFWLDGWVKAMRKCWHNRCNFCEVDIKLYKRSRYSNRTVTHNKISRIHVTGRTRGNQVILIEQSHMLKQYLLAFCYMWQNQVQIEIL